MQNLKHQPKKRVARKPLPKTEKELAKEVENKYAPKERIGAKKKVSAPGAKVTRVGLGNLEVVHINPPTY